MKTLKLPYADAAHEEQERTLEQAATLLRQGSLVAYPTETVYGLGALGLDTQAVEAVYRAKGRPQGRPLLLAIAELAMLVDLVREIPAYAQELMEAFWPGPLSLVLLRSSQVPDRVTAGGNGVGIRFSDHPLVKALVGRVGAPITSPSANKSGAPSPRSADAVFDQLEGRIAAIIDGGVLQERRESTVVDCTGPHPRVLRAGAIDNQRLQAIVGSLIVPREE